MTLASLLLLALLPAADPASDAEIKITAGREPTHVTVSARLPERLQAAIPAGEVQAEMAQRWLTLRLLDAEGEAGPPMFGSYQRSGERLIFTPRYGLSHGQRYAALLKVSEDKTLRSEYTVPPRQPSQRAVVEKIYPTAHVLPANHLKFYLHFSKPMREGRAIFERIHLLDEQGERVLDPWRRTELWTTDARRFTLWIHPGRVKQGVNLRTELGPVLEPGKSYTLVLSEELQDAGGQPLKQPATKKFRVSEIDHARPLPQNWKVTPPASGTRKPMILDFGEPLDAPLAERFISIVDPDGRRVAGTIELSEHESQWRLTPQQPWRAGKYGLQVNPLLEDLAGNTPQRVFDTDLENIDKTRPVLARLIVVE